MKALEILNNGNIFDESYVSENNYQKLINEAISELEALENRSCDSCKTKNCSVRRILVEKDEISTDYFNCNDWESK